MTPERSSFKTMSVTLPTSTSLNLILVLPASRPSAVSKEMVMTGPFSVIALKVSQPPISRAMIGTTQIIEKLRLVCTTASGACSACFISEFSSLMFFLHNVPDQPRVKAFGGDHGRHNNQSKIKGCRAGFDICQETELDQGNQDGHNIDVEHRPAADRFCESIQSGAIF